MSQASIPNITPTINVPVNSTVPLLLSSIALEELALAHIVNTEAEKLQYVLGTLTPSMAPVTPGVVTLSSLMNVNRSIRSTLQDVIKHEMLLQFKLGNTLDLIQSIPPPPPVLTIQNSDNPDPVIVLGPTVLTYTITVENTGPTTATGVVMTDTLPPSGGVNGPAFNLNTLSLPPECVLEGPVVGGNVVCNLGTLLPNEVRVLSFDGLVTSLVSGTLTNTISVNAMETLPTIATEDTDIIVP
ncbi:hypothetical protein [Paenibacillus sp. YYML68]|uniref:hypothetical protein n=1 Tax=Paenibacillus sp. YYML68 TaxID=2909250 RepID=UPI002852D38E|nr:hypothetical protein [Paenibacillus sp. YYML68]